MADFSCMNLRKRYGKNRVNLALEKRGSERWNERGFRKRR
jgi:hypothetical protein